MESMKTEYCGTVIELLQADIGQVKAEALVSVLDRDLPDGGSGKAFRWLANGNAYIAVRGLSSMFPAETLEPPLDCDGVLPLQGKDESGQLWTCSAGDIIPYPVRTLFGHQFYYYTVAPIWKGGHDDEALWLSSCYRTALEMTEKLGHTSIAFPSIGAGSEGYPLHLAAPVALAAIGAWLRKPRKLREIRLALNDEVAFEVYRDTLKWFLAENAEAVNLNRHRAIFQGMTSPDVFGLAAIDNTPSTFTNDLVTALGCPCLEFHQPDSMQSIIKTYRAYQELGKEAGFLPLLTESEMGLNYHVKLKDWYEGEKTAEEAAKSASSLDVPAWIKNELSKYSDGMLEYYKRDEGLIKAARGRNDFTVRLQALEDGEPLAWNIILACIPETEPWMLPFWITPSNGYSRDPMMAGDAPSMIVQMAFFKRWHEAYGAVPAVVKSDSWALTVERPPETYAAAEALAWEHLAFCPEHDQMGLEPDTIRALAEQLLGAKVWHFWWD
ncbi:DUF4253 domain-containing protein [Deltaproteobacteria bacterium OttesenSCG-928-K17]|nr:DUF4253 domain-containing protein [Deltaproteobacteria bacterium OttesenSCG-928-K17]